MGSGAGNHPEVNSYLCSFSEGQRKRDIENSLQGKRRCRWCSAVPAGLAGGAGSLVWVKIRHW